VFQLRYTKDILAPWGFIAPTGYVYTTTTNKINEIYCAATAVTPTLPTTANFTQHLQYGAYGSQVVLLQDLLKKLGFFPRSIESNGNFGPTTLKAVEDFQVYYNVAKPGDVGYGDVGPATRAVLNKLITQ
jgi:peptidoglycan hydrolase-like protein with peptidoglycan-binding domain